MEIVWTMVLGRLRGGGGQGHWIRGHDASPQPPETAAPSNLNHAPPGNCEEHRGARATVPLM
jgi:hypothetical protein